jgi:hypothetical protein
MQNSDQSPDIHRNECKRSSLRSALLLMVLMVYSTACRPRITGVGILTGHVTIGPLAPVLREGETEPTPSPEIYAQREVVIFDARGKREINRVQVDANGNYKIELPTGVYTVDINRIGIDTAAGLPTQIELRPDEIVRLDISIDTGIR